MEKRTRRRFPVGGFAILLIVIAALAVAASDRIATDATPTPDFVISERLSPTAATLNEATIRERAVDPAAFLTDAEQSQRQIEAVARVAPAVISVHRSSNGATDVIGSGVIIDASGLAIASLRTTGTDGKLTAVLSTGETVKATIVRVDEPAQLVLLRLDGDPPAVATLASRTPLTGERVLAIGTPLGDFTSTVTAGVIGAIGVAMPASGDQQAIEGVIQHDAATNPGSEGGPLIDLNGEVIAIELGAVTTTAQDGIVQGWSFAIPATTLGPLITG